MIEFSSDAPTRAERHAWLVERGYRVLDVAPADVEADVAAVLDRLASEMRENT